MFRFRLPLLQGEAEYRRDRDHGGECEATTNLPCSLADRMLEALARAGMEAEEGGFLLGVNWYGHDEHAAAPSVELRELYLPAQWVAEVSQ